MFYMTKCPRFYWSISGSLDYTYVGVSTSTSHFESQESPKDEVDFSMATTSLYYADPSFSNTINWADPSHCFTVLLQGVSPGSVDSHARM